MSSRLNGTVLPETNSSHVPTKSIHPSPSPAGKWLGKTQSPKKPKTAQEKPLLSAAGTICVTPLAPACWKKDLHSRLSLRSLVGVRAQRFVWRSGMVILAKPPSAKLWKPSALVRSMWRRCAIVRSSRKKVGQIKLAPLHPKTTYELLPRYTFCHAEWSRNWAQ